MKKTNNILNDTLYRLTNDFIKNIQKHVDYNYINNLISDNGSFQYTINGVDVKFYTAEMAILLLQTKDLEVINRDTKNNELVKIDCTKYLNTYIEAFKQGQYYFENELKFSPNKLNSEEVQRCINNLRVLYYEHDLPRKALVYYKNNCPQLLTHKNISEWGYNSGIVSCIEVLFKTFKLEFELTQKLPTKFEHIFNYNYMIWKCYLKCIEDLNVDENSKNLLAINSAIFQRFLEKELINVKHQEILKFIDYYFKTNVSKNGKLRSNTAVISKSIVDQNLKRFNLI